MKKIFTLILFCVTMGLNAQIYVKSDASGTNNGSSWANAYTDLQSALNDTTNANIWIAKGTYKPTGPAGDTTVFYRMTRAKNIFGGFVGTETALTQRNPTTNVVILSGDVSGNDKADSVYVNKSDNRRHVLVVEPTVTGVASFDGITVSGGATKDTSRIRPAFREILGAGILSYASLNINNCKFSGNRGTVGSAVATFDLDSIQNIVVNITKSSFTKNGNIVAANTNQATTFGTALYVWKASSLKVDSCIFSENVGARGAFCVDSVLTSVLTNSSFTKNVNSAGSAGGGYYSIRTRSSIVRNCEFIENSCSGAGTGAAMYFEITSNTTRPSLNYSGDTTAVNSIEKCIFKGNKTPLGTIPAVRLVGGSNVLIKDNLFEDNSGESTFSGSVLNVLGNTHVFGRQKNITITNNIFKKNNIKSTATNVVAGAIWISNNSAVIEKCTFDNNVGVRGTGIMIFGSVNFMGDRVTIKDSEFNNNNSTNIGSAIHNSSVFTNSRVFVDNCKFNSNVAEAGGGGIFSGFKAATTVNNCEFISNSAPAGFGGAIRVFSDSSSLDVRNSSFLLNSSSLQGGAIIASDESKLNIVNCKFEGNRSTSRAGGALSLNASKNARRGVLGDVFVDRCQFTSNEGTNQGGAIDLQNKNVIIQNSIFTNNTATNDGLGGAISYNSVDTLVGRKLLLLNNTLDQNVGKFGSGITAYADTNSLTTALVELQNNLFTEEKGIVIEENKPKIVSLGGNLYKNDASKAFAGTKDIIDPTFAYGDETLFTLKTGSKAINGGVAAGAPTYDFNSKVRVGIPDIGAVENGATVLNVDEKYLTEVAVFPNPTAERLTILDEKGVNSGDKYIIFDIAGKIVQRGKVNDSRTLDVSNINGGEHFVRIYGEKILQAKFLVVR
jgi:hypothetical protein